MTSLLEKPREQEISIYDIEFIGLMEEINNRIGKFGKGERLKINSWIECLMAPTKNIITAITMPTTIKVIFTPFFILIPHLM